MAVLSMAAICLIIAVITARSSEDLKRAGLVLLLATMLYNLMGYCFGYWGARALPTTNNSRAIGCSRARKAPSSWLKAKGGELTPYQREK